MAKAVLDKNNIATVAGDINVFNFDSCTREYLSSAVEHLAVGVGLPAYSCTDAPGNKKDGFAIRRNADSTGWEYVADHRGETVYSTSTGKPMTVSQLGGYPEGTTTKAPSTQYDKWNGTEWVTDSEEQHAANVVAAEQQKANLLNAANSKISLWQTELQLGIISDDDKAALIAWIGYIKSVKAIDTSNAPDVIWPELPEA
ncbi:TPA: tail fiber assembly protein [Escherichia coli]|uniref:tail fiber assembly protein n=1 Tax=Enterobacteriaceae TaxID=543 RepID=UPI000BB64377|nr:MULTISPECIES: tail fiber assembly protein [Enterobacteriaceae]ELP4645858.1 tail fiber assembly protein [Salmonella enterica]ELI6002502.1 tail fiber assembly protein [Escherichia coli]ELK6133513.1 tail fiber assembly protein [Escherichia coli]MBA8161971.1 tail fiber assembly protein [Escherichia coli]MBL7280312.1 tail fiber assembly protein [Escherichia coli]